jgi:hypothetical protein
VLGEYLPYIVIAVVAAILIAVTVVLARLAWRRQVRRYIVGLLGRREALVAALKMTEATVVDLAAGNDSQLVAFTLPDSEERRALAEVARRMRLETSELANLALPKKLWSLADSLGTAAASLGSETARVGEASGEAVLDALAALDLAGVRESLRVAQDAFDELSEEYGLKDSAVYGGGLYI